MVSVLHGDEPCLKVAAIRHCFDLAIVVVGEYH
jgi:hypothetical protein